MKKLFLLVFLPALLMSQFSRLDNTGLGVGIRLESVRSTGMGGIAIALPDSFCINNTNPAFWGNFKYVTMNTGLDFRFNSDSKNFSTTGLRFSGFAFGVPVSKRVGILLGMAPRTRVGYKAIYEDSVATELTPKYRSESDVKGGISDFYFGIGWKLSGRTKAGIKISYSMGNYTGVVGTDVDINGGYESFLEKTQELIIRNVSLGFNFDLRRVNLGLICEKSLGGKVRTLYDFFYGTDSVTSYKNLGFVETYGIGITGKIDKKRFVGFECRFERVPSNIFKKLLVLEEYRARNSVFVAAGYETFWRLSSKKKYYNRVFWRSGIYFWTYPTHAEVFEREYGITFGWSYEFHMNSSRLDLSVVLARREGCLYDENLQEKLAKLRVSLSMGEVWFVKIRKR